MAAYTGLWVDANGKFGEHERNIKVARRVAERSSSLLCALYILDIHTAKSMNQFFYNIATTLHLVSKLANEKCCSLN